MVRHAQVQQFMRNDEVLKTRALVDQIGGQGDDS